ncbi:MAG TPA: chemotaxis protein CheW, partial [Thermomicrobiales bacterium]|nr:chemotaxis protein CheW [Thermomicrobiales bacterium]
MSAATRPPGPDAAGRAAATRLMRFTVGGATCAFPLDRVGEVVSLTRLPARVPRGWVGALRRDRALVPVADLAGLLGLPAAPVADRAILLRTGRGAGLGYGVTTDDVPTVALAGPAAPTPLPPAAGAAARALVAGVLVG